MNVEQKANIFLGSFLSTAKGIMCIHKQRKIDNAKKECKEGNLKHVLFSGGEAWSEIMLACNESWGNFSRAC